MKTTATAALSASDAIHDPLLFRRQLLHLLLFDVVPLTLGVAALAFWPMLRPRIYDVAVFFVTWLVTLLGISVGFHRLFTHQSFKCGAALKYAFGFAGSMAAAGPVISWVATHRKHHTASDVAGDPHSPQLGGNGWLGRLRGLWHAQMGWLVGALPSPLRYARDLLQDPVTLRINRQYFRAVGLGVIIPALGSQVFEPGWSSFVSCILWGGLIRIAVLHQVISSVNSICHVFGSQPFETKENSRNNFWVAIPTCGEGWHNNHHRFPSSAYIGLRRGELDLGGLLLALLQRSGLVWGVIDARQKLAAPNSSSE